jgi:hypothetical protein
MLREDRLIALHNRLKKVIRCAHVIKKIVDGSEVLHKCNCIAIKNIPYCSNHLKLYPEIYNEFIKSQSVIISERHNPPVIAKASKYNFIKKDFSNAYNEFYRHEGLIDLKNEIALMSATLNKLYAKNIDANSEDNLAELNAKIKIINQIRMLIKTMRELDEGKKTTISFNDLKIFMLNIGQVIKNHISDSTIQKSIAEEVFKLYNTNKDVLDATLADSIKV